MLARLRGMVQALDTPEKDAPHPEAAEKPPEVAATLPEAPVLAAEGNENVPLAMPVTPPAPAEAVFEASPAESTEPSMTNEPTAPVASTALTCPVCQSPRSPERSYCESCGYSFPPEGATSEATAGNSFGAPKTRIGGRYELSEQLNERLGIERFRGFDHGSESGPPVPVVILRGVLQVAETLEIPEAVPVESLDPGDEDVFPSFDIPLRAEPVLPSTTPDIFAWPSVGWEKALLEAADHPSFPAVVDYFCEDGYEYLVEELPTGELLWNVYDDPDADAAKRFGLLKQIAESLQRLHQGGVMLEGLRPDILVVSPEGQVRFTDLSHLLPLPVPADTPIRPTLYTAPELIVDRAKADARADLYSFGAMLYALHIGRELTENDFDRKTRAPKPFIPFFPDIHPAFGRLMTKTFVRDVNLRFPTDEASREDATGFTELIRTLEVCGRTLDNVRLEIAAWTTTGMVRTGNEDAFALLHGIESRQDDMGECALILLADGMGGYEAGEVAAALAIQALRKYLLQQKPFQMLRGESPFASQVPGKDAQLQPPLNVEECKQLLLNALKDANLAVYQAPRSGIGRRGMGCTAEVVYVDGRHVLVGHVGDSRTYHLHEGRLVQLTRDQTLVNRLVELGQLTAEEAEDHPRKNELQQAIGGQPFVEPGIYQNKLSPGDWIIVCSDGLSNHVKPDELMEMLQGEAISAETAARRLTNLVNLKGATDNSTVVVVRVT